MNSLVLPSTSRLLESREMSSSASILNSPKNKEGEEYSINFDEGDAALFNGGNTNKISIISNDEICKVVKSE